MKKNTGGDFFYNLGRRSLSYAASFIYMNRINDMHTCYKITRKRLLDEFNLKGNGFDLDSEIGFVFIGSFILAGALTFLVRQYALQILQSFLSL